MKTNQFRRIKQNTEAILRAVGISEKHSQRLQNQIGELTGRKTTGTLQLAFDGKIIGWKRQFLYCVPHEALEELTPTP